MSRFVSGLLGARVLGWALREPGRCQGLINAQIEDMTAYRAVLGGTLVDLPGVRETRTYAVLEEVKNTVALPV